MAIIYLDTSSINKLKNDPAAPAIIADVVRKGHEVHTSCLNILELAATSDAVARIKLLQVARRITQNCYPIDMPGAILKSSLKAFMEGKDSAEWGIDPTKNGAWSAMCNPDGMDEAIRSKILTEKKQQEEWIKHENERARKAFDSQVRPTLYKPAHFLLPVMKDDTFLNSYFDRILKSAGDAQRVTSPAKVLVEVGPWRAFFTAIALEHYNRCVRTMRFGNSSNPGGIDVLQATYLPGHDIFVTDDYNQRRFMRNVCRIASIKTVVMTYAQMLAQVMSIHLF